MAFKYSEDMYKKIKDELKGMSCEDGGWNPGHLWKLKTKISPRPVDPPTAIENSNGILLTDQQKYKKEPYFIMKDFLRIPSCMLTMWNCKLRKKNCALINVLKIKLPPGIWKTYKRF